MGCALVSYSTFNFVGSTLDQKSISGTCHLLGNSLVSWHNKKQANVVLSTIDVAYVVGGIFCVQIIWMTHQLSDYGVDLVVFPIKCDNTSAINLTKNLVFHSHAKHIDVNHHFIRYHVKKGDCEIYFVPSSNQLSEFFTKLLPKGIFFS